MEKFECGECHNKFKSLDEYLRCPYCKGHMDKIHTTARTNNQDQEQDHEPEHQVTNQTKKPNEN